MPAGETELLRILRAQGMTAAADLRIALGISPASLSRLAMRLGEQVVRVGRARASRYALRRTVRGLPAELPVYRVDAAGRPELAARLVLLAGGEHWIERASGGDHFEGLPPVIHDMAPQGFLGRRFSDMHPSLDLPRRLEDWSDDHRLIALARRGPDAPGNLVVGDESLERMLAEENGEVARAEYPALSRESAEGGAGSSAGGEQPKFTAFTSRGHLLVKFTSGDGSPAERRWRDLLASEALAANVIRDAGIPAARSEVVDAGTQRFLEVERFDRTGERGRRGVITLGPLDDDLYGRRDSWSEAAQRLQRAGLLSAEDARRVRLLDAFGARIGNGDRHFGNVSFFADGLRQRPPLELAPAYDMLPMAYAPSAGMVQEIRAVPVAQRAYWLDVWEGAGRMAADFWRRVQEEERISAEFRAAVAGFAP